MTVPPSRFLLLRHDARQSVSSCPTDSRLPALFVIREIRSFSLRMIFTLCSLSDRWDPLWGVYLALVQSFVTCRASHV